MDRKSILVIVGCIGLMFVWSAVLVPKYFMNQAPPRPVTTNAPAARGTNTALEAAAPATATSAAPAVPGVAFVRPAFDTNSEQLVVLTNENARYTFTSLGGGLKTVQLVKFPENVSSKHAAQSATNELATLNPHAHLPVLAVIGGEAVQGDGVFTLTTLSANSVRAEKTLANGLRLVKEFTLSTNYLINTSVRLENTGSNNLALPPQDWVVGTATPMGPYDDASALGIMWYDGKKTHETLYAWFENKRFGCLPGTPRPEFRDGNTNVVWISAHNQFFSLTAMPDATAQQLVVRTIDLPRPTEGRFSFPDSPVRKGLETTIVYPALNLEPGKTVEHKFNLFIGPKEYRTLATIAGRFGNDVDSVMGFGMFGFVSKPLLLGMNWLHSIGLGYGLAIVAITVILKIVFWPLTAASTRSAQRMSALGPQLNALKEKYKDDPAKASQKQMEFFRENKINPAAGCFPMLVQLPVFFGLFAMLRTAIELRGAHFLWAIDLSRSDTLFVIPGLSFVPFMSTPEGLPFNLFPILYIASALWQTHATPMSPGMDPTQQKLMRWMPLMFLAILYNFSSGLALYMIVNNLLTILQTKMMKKPEIAAAVGEPAKASVLTPASKKKK